MYLNEGASSEYAFVILFSGTPSEKIWPGYNKLPGPQKMKFVDFPVSNLRSKFPKDMLSDIGMDFLKKLLTYDPKKRLTCDQVRPTDYCVCCDQCQNHIQS